MPQLRCENTQVAQTNVRVHEKQRRQPKHLWISMGGQEDIAFNNCKVMMAKFDELGVKYQYSEYAGGHTWTVWRHDLFMFAQELFK